MRFEIDGKLYHADSYATLLEKMYMLSFDNSTSVTEYMHRFAARYNMGHKSVNLNTASPDMFISDLIQNGVIKVLDNDAA